MLNFMSMVYYSEKDVRLSIGHLKEFNVVSQLRLSVLCKLSFILLSDTNYR